MSRGIKKPLAVVTSGATVLLGLVLGAGTAAADTTSCTIPSSGIGCSTRAVSANSAEHAVKMTVFAPDGGTTTCRVHDAVNGIEVGILSNSSRLVAKTKRITGLYASYFLSCLKTGSGGGGGGALTNGS
ncbi:hypothetical protein AMES_6365 [Amycolatopsis mediterranei S699]|uniref:Secreted protein n=2 Tax=Amycolatopsis mediterranei TaxID=33910 RepID=A0A0H3DAZ6_AMYMU|nr:hypothetical protein [Amycolatopsis mediterranei]ADJ48190.1 hypothetical protein AMED_6458 [Amycolatopsis mediterranei U32]AEK45095.1 hypothetical protein RAM_33110 [Amycolatopsis mediterranei S699]AFO79901.1 hypothetical protein AMES_6365 [Amycolatopsis mediterranei S699]AGT87029.1 hypothetical protein B737_6365 [Amycolatopsis mediterranei RB]KDO10676.1 hypothetical protein DV26_12370 [Amycolatopsis mediterranei]